MPSSLNKWNRLYFTILLAIGRSKNKNKQYLYWIRLISNSVCRLTEWWCISLISHDDNIMCASSALKTLKSIFILFTYDRLYSVKQYLSCLMIIYIDNKIKIPLHEWAMRHITAEPVTVTVNKEGPSMEQWIWLWNILIVCVNAKKNNTEIDDRWKTPIYKNVSIANCTQRTNKLRYENWIPISYINTEEKRNHLIETIE